MKIQRAVVIGASGLVGSHLVNELLKDDSLSTIRTLVRKPIAIQHSKLQQEIVDFEDMNNFTEKFGSGEVIFCCVGTTSKKVNGDINAYKKIDLDIPLNAAQIGIAQGFKKFLIVSSAGANANAKNFYLKLKGDVENKLREFPFHRISIFRPGQLLGKRNEYRRGEKYLQAATSFLSLFLFGKLKKYHSIEALDVAKVMVAESKKEEAGIFILEYPEIKKLLQTPEVTSDQHLQ